MHAYLDNAATTPVAPEVVKAMMDVYTSVHGNPSSTHAPGRKAKALIETSRRTIASLLGVPPRTICFTSGGTEADNHAIQAAVSCLGVNRIITSAAEHSARRSRCRHPPPHTVGGEAAPLSPPN